MTRTIIRLLLCFHFLRFDLAVAQSLSAYRFLDGVSAHPVGDQVEMKQSPNLSALIIAPPADVKRVLSAVLVFAPRHQFNVGACAAPAPARHYHSGLTGPFFLSSKSEEISCLIADVNPRISGRYRQHRGNA